MRVPIRIPSYSKYRAQRTDGYASKREAKVAADLNLRAQIGDIYELREQVRFELIAKDDLGPAVVYVADFTYRTHDGCEHVIDAKGVRTPVYRLKKRLMLSVHKIRIEEV